MSTLNIFKKSSTVSLLVLKKLKFFIAAAIIAEWFIGGAFIAFFQNLNNKNLLGLGSNFKANYIIWGDSVWLNIIHVFILAIIAGVFGFTFGYLLRKISLGDKIVFSTLYIFLGSIFVSLLYLLIKIFLPDNLALIDLVIHESFSNLFSSTFNITFFIINLIVMLGTSFFFMEVGANFITNSYYDIDKQGNNTLFGIKWYHYLWLIFPISIYIQIILNLIFKTGSAIVVFFKDLNFIDFFVGASGNDREGLLVVVFAFVILFFLLNYLYKILKGETNQHWALKTLLVILIGFVIPILIIAFPNFLSYIIKIFI